MTNPLRQAVARAIVEVAQEEGGLALTLISNRSDLLADAAIAIVLEEAAGVCDRRAIELNEMIPNEGNFFQKVGYADRVDALRLVATAIRSLGDPS